jgi:hypothetical protein
MTVRNFENRFGRRGMRGTELVHGPAARTFGRGRVCLTAGCGTPLSLYNPNSHCWVHSNS